MRYAGAGVFVVALVASAMLVHGQVADEGWRQASPDYRLAFPRDHASHPAYRIEWWYYTGNLVSDDGSRRFGYQVTFFRVGVDREPSNPSRWAVRDLFMAHLAVTDLESGTHLVAERLNRAGAGWAGARTDRLEVWNEDWRVEREGDDHVVHLMSDDPSFGVDLRLREDRAPVLHGVGGFSQKGTTPGNASHYYSLTRMPTTGEIWMGGERVRVAGDSWMDHEFGTSFLEASQVGWDWFSLQLDDGTDVMVYQIRTPDGRPHPSSSGTVVDPSGVTYRLRVDEYELTPGRIWSSPTSGARYPVAWAVRIPDRGLELQVAAVVDAQELHTRESTGVTYWEGAILVGGSRDGQPVSGRGYLEMTGYVGQPMSEVLR